MIRGRLPWILTGFFAVGSFVAANAVWCRPADPDPGTEPTAWTSVPAEFKAQLHALAAEALVLQIKSSPPRVASGTRPSRKVRQDAQTRLADSLRAANALLSMLEIAEHSDRGDRVRKILELWLDSSSRSLADHLKNAGGLAPGTSIDADTAAFLEEMKMLWRRLDAAYATLGGLVG